MSDPVDIEVRIKAAKAEVTLAKLNAALKITEEREKQVAIKTQIMNQRLLNAAKAGTRAGKGFKVANIAMASFIGNITSRLVSSGITSLINGMRGLVNAGKDFEVGLVNVSKTTGISGKALESLGRSIQNIGRTIPVSTEALLEIATVAGQLGLKGSSNIIQFTKTMAKLQLATNITGEEGSQAVAKILTLTGELEKDGSRNIQKFGSVITKLGNDFAATESQILKVANEIAKGTAAFDVASEDVLGLATAFKATGSEAESSGSAIQRTFFQMGKAIEAGGKKLTLFSEAAGLTGDEFSQLFKSDPTKAFLALAKGLGDTTENGAQLATKLGELGLGSLRVTKALVPLISRYGLLSRSISTARQESEDLTALNEETLKAQDTLAADLVLLSNSFDRFGTVLFETVGPALRSIIQGMTDFLDVMGEMLNRKVLIGIAGGVTAVAVGLLGLNKALILVAIKSIPIMIVALAKLAVAATVATGGLNLIIPALAAIGVAAALYVDKMGDAERATSQANETAIDLSDTYDELSKSSKGFLDGLNEYTTLGKTVVGLNGEIIETNKDLSRSYVELIHANQVTGDEGDKTAKRITLFEQKKTEELKKFFKEEEIAKLSAAFLMQKSDEDRIAFTAFVVSRGKALRTDAFKTSIGQGKAQVAAERDRQAELKSLRKSEVDFLEEMQKRRDKTIADQKSAELDLATSQEANRLFSQESEIIFTDERLIRLEDFFTRQREAEIQAAINAAQTEQEKQLLITKAQKEGQDNRFKSTVDSLKQETDANARSATAGVSIARNTGDLINAIAGKQTKAGFIISKAAALAGVIVNTQAAAALATAQLGAFAAPVVAKIEIAGAIQAATIAASAITGFEEGGIVGGTSFTGDKVQARVNSGEMILNRSQQKQLFNMANGSSGGDSQVININTKVMLDDEVVGEANSRWVANGGQTGEVQ